MYRDGVLFGRRSSCSDWAAIPHLPGPDRTYAATRTGSRLSALEKDPTSRHQTLECLYLARKGQTRRFWTRQRTEAGR
jgi:hypothetical protein